MHTQYHESKSDEQNPRADYWVQQAARDAVMKIPLFPDLDVLLIDKLAYGPHCKMLQHFVYWFHPRHPKMQERWTMYKTYKEWRYETGLKRNQVEKGRKKLRELGLVTEKKGPHGRIHYQVDWVALAEALSLSPVGEHSDSIDGWFDDLEDEISLSPIGGQGQNVPLGEQSSLSPVGGQANTGEDAGDYLQESSLLQRAPELASAEPGAQEMNGKERGKKQTHSPPKPGNVNLLAEVRAVLDPESGRWENARYVAMDRNALSAERVANYIRKDAEDIARNALIKAVPPDELEKAVGYVLWKAQEEVS